MGSVLRGRTKGRVSLFGVLPAALLTAAFWGRTLGGAEAIRLPESPDAWLEDVFFLDLQQGWCVGREGVIWHTRDGGRHWTLQHAEPGIILHAVHFVDELRGWAVGGRVHPLTWRTSAVVLRTTSGGRRWTPLKTEGIAELYGVRFFSERLGVAFGRASTIYPTGVLRTEDGGRSWIGVSGDSVELAWTDAAWSSPDEGVLIGDRTIALVSAGQLRTTFNLPPSTMSRLRRLVGSRSGELWLVGDRGLLRRRTSPTQSWRDERTSLPPAFRPAPSELSRSGALSSLVPDFHAVARWQNHLWVAGAPGSFVLHSSDNGRSWEVQRTGITVPLSDLCFIDDHHGWGVGALGTIVATRDGGRSWTIQRRGGERLALWGLHRSPQRLPLPLLSYFSSQEGWLTGVTMMSLGIPERRTAQEADMSRRILQAVSAVGASTATIADRFPVVEMGGQASMTQTLAVWQQTHGRPVQAKWLDFLRWQLAQWRPDVVSFGNFADDSGDALDHFIHRTLLQLGQRQATFAEFPARLQAWGLEPWNPRTIIELTPLRRRATESMPMTQLMPMAYTSVGFHAWPARLFLTRKIEPWPSRIGWRIARQPSQARGSSRLLTEHGPAVRGVNRRASPQLALRLQRINQIASSLRDLQTWVDEGSHWAARPDWQGRLQSRLRQLPPQQAGQALFRLALVADRDGDTDTAAALAHQLIEQFPGHPYHEAALWWLVRYEGCREGHIRSQTEPAHQAVVQASHTVPADSAESLSAWEQLTGAWPEYQGDPRVTLPQAARLRDRDPAESERLWRAVAGAAEPGWVRLAKGELWLTERRGGCPVPMLALRDATRPHLDGESDEPMWQQALLTTLASQTPSSSARTEIRWACDHEYLYFFAHCSKVPGRRYLPLAERTARDQANRQLDHLVIALDIDRDTTTAFHLVIDARGWVSDDGQGDRRWDPQWYVAVRESPRDWRVECAIAWKELGVDAPAPDFPIGVRVRRIIPGHAELQWPAPKEPSWGWLIRSHNGASVAK